MGGNTVPITAVIIPTKPATRQPTRIAALTAIAPVIMDVVWGLGGKVVKERSLFPDPVQFIHKFPFHESNDHKTAAKGKCAYV